MREFTSLICRVLFVASFILAGLAVFEKLSNVLGYTLLRDAYAPGRLLDLAGIALLFVIALLLREIRYGVTPKAGA